MIEVGWALVLVRGGGPPGVGRCFAGEEVGFDFGHGGRAGGVGGCDEHYWGGGGEGGGVDLG